jgi:CshA-type fibril repeat protein
VVANDTSYTGTPISASTIKLFDPVSDTYVSTSVTLADGTYSIVDGRIQFMPNNNFVGTAAPVTYQITDSAGLTDTATYTPTVAPSPIAVDDTPAPGPHNTAQIIPVLLNDTVSPVTQSAFVVTSVNLCDPATGPPQVAPNCSVDRLTTVDGIYHVNEDGTVTFTPAPGFSGIVTVPVSYQVADTDGQVISAVITPSVKRAPTADDDTTTGAYLEVQTADVLAGDASYTGQPLDPGTLRIFDPAANSGAGAFVTTPVTVTTVTTPTTVTTYSDGTTTTASGTPVTTTSTTDTLMLGSRSTWCFLR